MIPEPFQHFGDDRCGSELDLQWVGKSLEVGETDPGLVDEGVLHHRDPADVSR